MAAMLSVIIYRLFENMRANRSESVLMKPNWYWSEESLDSIKSINKISRILETEFDWAVAL